MKALTVLKGITMVVVLGLIFCTQTPQPVIEKPVPPPVKTAVTPEKPVPVPEKPVPIPEKPVPPPVEMPNFDTIVPEDVYAYLSLENVSRWGDVINQSLFNKLWNDTEVQVFVEKITDLLQKEAAKNNVGVKTQVTLKDITSLSEVFCGQVAVVLDSIELKTGKKKESKIVRDEEGKPIWDDENKSFKYEEVDVECIQPMPHFIMLAQVSQNKDKLESLIEKHCAGLAEQEIYKQKDDYKDITYFTFYKNKESTNFSYGYIGDIFFIAYGDKGLKRVVDLYKGSEKVKPLNARVSYQKLLAEIGPNRLSTVFVNCPPLVSSLKQWAIKTELLSQESFTPEKIDEMNKTWDTIIELSGLGDLKSINCGTRFEGDGLVSVSFLDIPGAKRGLWKILSSSATTEFKTLKAVPKDTLVYMAGAFSLPEVYDEIMNIIANVVPKEEYENEVIAGIKEFEQKLGFKLKEDLLSVFGNEFALLEDMGKADPNNPMSGAFMGIPIKLAIVAPVAQADKFNQIHDQIMKTIGEGSPMPLVEKKYEGFTFHVMEMPSFAEGQEPTELMGYFFTKDMFVLAMPGNYLKEIADALSGKDKGSLLTDPDFVKLLDKNKIEGKKTSVAYVDMAKYIDLYSAIFSAAEGFVMDIKSEKDNEFGELLKFLPKFETLKKYFNNCKSYSQVYPTPDGIMGRGYLRIITEEGAQK